MHFSGLGFSFLRFLAIGYLCFVLSGSEIYG